jgi:phosphohistidine phosphatase SixA
VARRPERARAFGLALLFLLVPVVGLEPRGARQDAGSPAAGPAVARELSTVILVRHAERDAAGDPKDPGLSEAGRKRSQALARLLARSGATHFFASEFKRTQETLAPLVEMADGQTGAKVEVVGAGKARELVGRLRALPAGSVSVVAGHSNTLPALIAELGGQARDLEKSPQGPVLPDTAFDRLYVVTFAPASAGAESATRTSVVELRYGD